jgi:hypothetical protein
MFQYEILDITESVVGSVEPWNFASQWLNTSALEIFSV